MKTANPSGLTLLPCAPDVCQSCAVKHEPGLPHDQQSLYWNYWFYGKNGRWPTWRDAMAHCTPEMQEHWIHALAEHGVEVPPPSAPACADGEKKPAAGRSAPGCHPGAGPSLS